MGTTGVAWLRLHCFLVNPPERTFHAQSLFKLRQAMPEYQSQRDHCAHGFSVAMTMNDHKIRENEHEIRCPKCDNNDVRHPIESFFVNTARMSRSQNTP
jgi:uncharacterized membrane-anchored protein